MSLRRQLLEDEIIKRTKASSFLLPMIPNFKEILASPYYIHTFIYSIATPSIVVVLEDTGLEEDRYYIESLINNCVADASYDTTWDDDGEVIVKFKIPRKYKLDFQTFVEGKYSKLSDQLKRVLMDGKKEESGKGYRSTMYDTLNPTENKKKKIAEALGVKIEMLPEEVLDIPIISQEGYYTIDELKLKYESTKI